MRSSPNRLLATALGVAYVVIGVAGFFVPAGQQLFAFFGVNTAHNIVHIVIGAALVLAGVSSVRAAQLVNSVVGTVYLLLGLVGLFVVTTPFNYLAINGADNVLHFGSAVLLLGVGLGAERAAPANRRQ
jgi:hypothetical protein